MSTTTTPRLREWLEHHCELHAGTVGDRTAANYRTTYDLLSAAWGSHKRLSSVSPADADDWVMSLRRGGRTEETVCSHVRRAKGIFARAKLRGLIGANPFDGQNSTAPEPIQDWAQLTAENIAAIVAACPSPEWERLVGLCAYAGLRRGEATRVTYGDIDVEKRRLRVVPPSRHVTTKQRPREVLLVDEMLALLAEEARPEELVIGAMHTSGPYLHNHMVGWDMRPTLDHPYMHHPGIIALAQVEPFCKPFHTLRKWRAETWADQYPEWVAAAWLGHSIRISRKHYKRVPERYYRPKTDRSDP